MKEKGLDKSYKNYLKEMREYELKTERRKKSMILKKTHLSTTIEDLQKKLKDIETESIQFILSNEI